MLGGEVEVLWMVGAGLRLVGWFGVGWVGFLRET